MTHIILKKKKFYKSSNTINLLTGFLKKEILDSGLKKEFGSLDNPGRIAQDFSGDKGAPLTNS